MRPAAAVVTDTADWFRWSPDRIAAAVRACPDVVRLEAAPARAGDPEAAAEVATYLPGRRVAGVRVRPDLVRVQVVCRYGPRLGDLADRIRAAVLAVAPDCPRVDVVIHDLDGADAPASAAPDSIATRAGSAEHHDRRLVAGAGPAAPRFRGTP